MTDLPILFSAPMIRALLAGTKTQTRRVAWKGNSTRRSQPTIWQKVKPGDRLYVRETWHAEAGYDDTKPRDIPDDACMVYYPADQHWSDWDPMTRAGKTRVCLHMPRWASRLTLIVTDVGIEPLQAISDEDAVEEGVTTEGAQPGHDVNIDGEWWPGGPSRQYRKLWESLHGADSWAANPDVVVLTFRVEKQNIDTLPVAA